MVMTESATGRPIMLTMFCRRLPASVKDTEINEAVSRVRRLPKPYSNKPEHDAELQSYGRVRLPASE